MSTVGGPLVIEIEAGKNKLELHLCGVRPDCRSQCPVGRWPLVGAHVCAPPLPIAVWRSSHLSTPLHDCASSGSLLRWQAWAQKYHRHWRRRDASGAAGSGEQERDEENADAEISAHTPCVLLLSSRGGPSVARTYVTAGDAGRHSHKQRTQATSGRVDPSALPVRRVSRSHRPFPPSGQTIMAFTIEDQLVFYGSYHKVSTPAQPLVLACTARAPGCAYAYGCDGGGNAHSNFWNKLIHFFFVPSILVSTVVFLQYTPVRDSSGQAT
eukprot:scaffold1414_cov384-Prasinococcus_capsulatus_cf.AAC.12